MTEYDYSPEAYERHMATQNRIARWVDTTQQYPQQNPFTPATPAPTTVHHPLPRSGRRDDRSHHTGRDSRRRSPSASGSGRAHPPRPRTAPPREDVYGQQHAQHSKHLMSQYPLPQQVYTPKPARKSSHSSSHHSSSTRPSALRSQTYMAPPPQPMPSRYPVRSNTQPAYGYPVDGRSPVVVPTGAGMVLVPPRGKHIEVVVSPCFRSYDSYFLPTFPFQSPQAYYPQQPFAAYQSPKQPPLLKRLFTGLTGGTKHSSSGGSRRRSRRDSF